MDTIVWDVEVEILLGTVWLVSEEVSQQAPPGLSELA